MLHMITIMLMMTNTVIRTTIMTVMMIVMITMPRTTIKITYNYTNYGDNKL